VNIEDKTICLHNEIALGDIVAEVVKLDTDTIVDFVDAIAVETDSGALTRALAKHFSSEARKMKKHLGDEV